MLDTESLVGIRVFGETECTRTGHIGKTFTDCGVSGQATRRRRLPFQDRPPDMPTLPSTLDVVGAIGIVKPLVAQNVLKGERFSLIPTCARWEKKFARHLDTAKSVRQHRAALPGL